MTDTVDTGSGITMPPALLPALYGMAIGMGLAIVIVSVAQARKPPCPCEQEHAQADAPAEQIADSLAAVATNGARKTRKPAAAPDSLGLPVHNDLPPLPPVDQSTLTDK